MSGSLKLQEQRTKNAQDRKKELVSTGMKTLGKSKNNFPTDAEIEAF
jgi:hypothetical protein